MFFSGFHGPELSIWRLVRPGPMAKIPPAWTPPRPSVFFQPPNLTSSSLSPLERNLRHHSLLQVDFPLSCSYRGFFFQRFFKGAKWFSDHGPHLPAPPLFFALGPLHFTPPLPPNYRMIKPPRFSSDSFFFCFVYSFAGSAGFSSVVFFPQAILIVVVRGNWLPS